ncbi:MAG: hypothetical protein ACOY0S_04700 [Patescibacteria group bacterium]
MTKALAQLTNPVLPPSLGGGTSPSTELGGQAIGKLISNIVGLIFIFSFLLAFLYLLTGSVAWITSGGDKAGMETARNKVTHAIVGLIIVGAAWAIMVLVQNFLGVTIIGGTVTLPKPF